MTIPASNHPATVLIVDDDRMTIQLLQEILQKDGYHILDAGDAIDGLQLMESHQPDLVISDYHMPNIDGLAFCRQVKQHPVFFDTMFILLTADTDEDKKVAGLEGGADDWITKPFKSGELRSRVRALLRIKALQQQLKTEHHELEQLHLALQGNLRSLLSLITHIIGLRVPDANLRSQRAARLAHWIGRHLQLSDRRLEMLEVATLVHEIGKIVLPDRLLKIAPADMSADDRDQISHFPVLGQRLVQPVEQLADVARFLRHQMENYDGSGYPDKLRAEEIPLEARILRGINVLEDADWEENTPVHELIAHLQHLRLTVLDPRIVQLIEQFLRIEQCPAWSAGKHQISLDELEDGMVLADDLVTGNGIKLLSSGCRLSRSNIQRILAIHRTDPIINEVYIQNLSAVAPETPEI